MPKSVFPLCQLHGTKIVNGFPAGCPMGAENMHDRLVEIRNAGWSQLVAENHHESDVLLRVQETCTNCLGRLLRNAHVKHLREKHEAAMPDGRPECAHATHLRERIAANA